MNTLFKKIGAFAVALALCTSVAGSVAVPSVRAESGHSSAFSSANEETVIKLLEDLIKLLTQRLDALLKERGAVTTSDDDEDDDASCSDDQGLSELEATIYTNETVVKIELDGDKDVFVTDADTRAEILDAILDEYSSLDEDDADDLLSVEEEDRASRAKDKDWAADDKNSCDDSDDDEDEDDDDDEDEDDDHHGHGGDDDEDEDEDD